MAPFDGATPTRVAELQHGDETVEFGVVTHREGRKVWFEDRIVTFPSDDDRVTVRRRHDE